MSDRAACRRSAPARPTGARGTRTPRSPPASSGWCTPASRPASRGRASREACGASSLGRLLRLGAALVDVRDAGAIGSGGDDQHHLGLARLLGALVLLHGQIAIQLGGLVLDEER